MKHNSTLQKEGGICIKRKLERLTAIGFHSVSCMKESKSIRVYFLKRARTITIADSGRLWQFQSCRTFSPRYLALFWAATYSFRFLLQNISLFEKSISKPPQELSLPLGGSSGSKSTRQEITEIFRLWRSDSTFYDLWNGNFLVFFHKDQNPVYPRLWITLFYKISNNWLGNVLRFYRLGDH